MALIGYELKMNKGVRVLKKLWCSVSGVVKYKDCFFHRFIEKIGHREELRSWQFRALALVRANQRIMAFVMVIIRGLEYCHTFFSRYMPISMFSCSLCASWQQKIQQSSIRYAILAHSFLITCLFLIQMCRDYTVLSEPNRQQSFGYGSNSDNRLVPCWYRFKSSSHSNAALI